MNAIQAEGIAPGPFSAQHPATDRHRLDSAQSAVEVRTDISDIHVAVRLCRGLYRKVETVDAGHDNLLFSFRHYESVLLNAVFFKNCIDIFHGIATLEQGEHACKREKRNAIAA